MFVSTDGRTCGEWEIPGDLVDREPVMRISGMIIKSIVEHPSSGEAIPGAETPAPTASPSADLLFVEERKIVVKTSRTRVTFVESDKPVYKPGDRVRIRLLTVDAALKPVLGAIDRIWIENPGGVRMEQWTNVSRETGFASVSMTLSEEPVKGVWKVKADVGGETVSDVRERFSDRFLIGQFS